MRHTTALCSFDGLEQELKICMDLVCTSHKALGLKIQI